MHRIVVFILWKAVETICVKTNTRRFIALTPEESNIAFKAHARKWKVRHERGSGNHRGPLFQIQVWKMGQIR